MPNLYKLKTRAWISPIAIRCSHHHHGERQRHRHRPYIGDTGISAIRLYRHGDDSMNGASVGRLENDAVLAEYEPEIRRQLPE